MKAWIISDIHSSRLDLLHPRPVSVPKADICICAGDVADEIERTIDFVFANIAPHMPVVMTLGNHDYYGTSIDDALSFARRSTAGTNVRVLENDEFRKDDLRIVGATLWTNFELTAHDYGHLPVDERRQLAIATNRRFLLDFRLIQASERWREAEGQLISAGEMIARHKESLAYIEHRLEERFDGTTIVLTHHAPSIWSLDPRFKGHVTNAAFASDLTSTIHRGKPHFWVHGHIHRFADYVDGDTSVLCNPRGYRPEQSGISGFRPGFVIETTPMNGDEGSQ